MEDYLKVNCLVRCSLIYFSRLFFTDLYVLEGFHSVPKFLPKKLSRSFGPEIFFYFHNNKAKH